MRSLRGFLAAIACLSALPTAMLYQMISGTGFETIFHLLFAVGLVLISFSVFDFRMPRWLTWTGCLSTGTLAAIFLLQGMSELIQNDSLTHLAYQVLGQWLERGLLDLLIFWFVALLLIDSQGKTRSFGFVVMSIVVCLEVYTYGLSYLGRAPAQILKLPYLLMFVWFLFESRRTSAFVAVKRLDSG